MSSKHSLFDLIRKYFDPKGLCVICVQFMNSMQEEERAALEKAEKKKQTQEAKAAAKRQPRKPRGRPSQVKVVTPEKASPKSKAKAKAGAKAKASPKKKTRNTAAKASPKAKAKGKAKAKASPKAKAKASPKKPSRKRGFEDEKPDGTPRLRENRTSSSSAAAKAKRKERAERVFANLRGESLPGFVLPKELGGRISFTQTDATKEGASIGVVLYSESFYITKPAPPASWPSTCNFLKARLCCIRNPVLKYIYFLCHQFSTVRLMEKEGLLFHGRLRFNQPGSMPRLLLHGDMSTDMIR